MVGSTSDATGDGGSALINLASESGAPAAGGGQEVTDAPIAAAATDGGALEAVTDGITDLGLAETIEVREEGRGLSLTLPGDLLFGVGNGRLSDRGAQTVRTLIPLLQRPGIVVSVEGHTDGTLSRSWSYRDNWDLSLARAVAVATAIAVMHALRCLHPPGGATALIAVIGGAKIHALGYLYALIPAGLGALVMLIIAVLVNNLAPTRRYPEYWW
ncbi:MAG TPA: hypothetical protein DC005_01450 [Proteobacteria bacterium]|nr:hypothetical protein [Pseudomonadota bacterium]